MLFFNALGLVLVVCCLLLSTASVAHASDKLYLLDETFSWITEEGAERYVAEAKSLGASVIVPCIWHGRGVSWLSSGMPLEPKFKAEYDGGEDPLTRLIRLSSKQGIEVHPWFTVTLRQADIFPEFSGEGVPEKSFDIHNVNFRDFIVQLVVNVAKNYDVSGVNLDYIRSKGICMSKACRQDYSEKTGRSLKVDATLLKLNSEAFESVRDWNYRAVTDVVRRVSNEVKKVGRPIEVSVDTHPVKKNWLLQGANGVRWANEGYVDRVFDMQYSFVLDEYSFERAKHQLTDPGKLSLMIGNFAKGPTGKRDDVVPRDAKIVARHMEQGLRLGAQSGAVAIYQLPYLSADQKRAIQDFSMSR